MVGKNIDWDKYNKMDDLEKLEMDKLMHTPPKPCDCDRSRGYSAQDGLGCYKGIASWRVEVVYNEVDKDTLYLCDECYKKLKTLTKRYGQKIKSKRYKNNPYWIGYE